MGKAYSEQERQRIKTQLLEAGLDLFHEGVRKISIRELTKRVGIAQGGFYSFFSDKDDLVMELIIYRAKQKIDIIQNTFDKSLKNPIGFVSEGIFKMSWDLKQKADKNKMYADIFRLLVNKKPSEQEKLHSQTYNALKNLAQYWEQRNLSIKMDIDGIINVINGALILYANLEQLDNQYSEQILKTFIVENCKNYIRKLDKEEENEAYKDF